MMEAQIWITGRVGSDVDYRAITNTFSVASFRLACTPRVQRDGEWKDDETTWITVRCGRSVAEGVKCSLSKGDPVIVVGKLRTHVWEDADHVSREQLRLEALTVGHDLAHGTSQFRRLSRAAENQPADNPPADNSPTQAANPVEAPAPELALVAV